MPDPSQTYNINGGVYCADFIGGDKHIVSYGFSAEDVERLIEKVLAFRRAGEVFLPVPDRPDALQVEHDGQKLVFQPGAARQLFGQGSERAYLLALSIDQEYQCWATHFVPLAGKMDARQMIEGLPISFTEFIVPVGESGMQTQATTRPLKDIAEAMQTHGAFVILGEPGAGKTTTQQKIAFDLALAQLEGREARIPLFVRLSQQGQRDPYSFLETEWVRRAGTPFARALAEGRILILADGINEIPREKRNERLKDWMLFEQQYRGANQLIFSGREKDYDNQLNLPRVLVEPLDEPRIAEFLKRHQAEGLPDLLNDPASRLNEMARNPLNLFVLVIVYLQGGKNLQVLTNRGKLFQSFSLRLLNHEQRWHPDSLSVDSKVDLFARLAYDMQKQGSGTTFALEVAKQAIPTQVMELGEAAEVDAAALLRFGRGASILDPATLPDVRFYHHLLQEYFAARELLRRFNGGEDLSSLWKTARTVDEMPPAAVGDWDPLPEPPASGWEVTTILACGLSRAPEKLIEAVRQVNPALAGRCIDESGSPLPLGEGPGPALSAVEGVRAVVRADLLADLYNPQIHLRTRLQAGFVLGRIGDPRFAPQEIGGVKVILPEMVDVPAGRYRIGSVDDSQAYDDESPVSEIDLPAFSMGKWPVTNAEFACFMDSGVYTDEAWWQGELAKRWLEGEDVAGGRFSTWVKLWKYFQDTPSWKAQLESSGNYSPQQIEAYEYVVGLSEDELKVVLSKQLSQKSRSQPAYWNDRQYNNPSQPVVGITWFETRAYCAWLSAVTGKPYRLPTEPEWEAAARGFSPLPQGEGPGVRAGARIYPWGNDWDAGKANSLEGRVLRPSPVGVYAAVGGLGPFGAEDQAGNVYEWTGSLYLPYPHDAAQSELLDVDGERVCRGGSWFTLPRYARCANRSRGVPDGFYDGLGFRFVSPGSDLPRRDIAAS